LAGATKNQIENKVHLKRPKLAKLTLASAVKKGQEDGRVADSAKGPDDDRLDGGR
jgi:hypothetical protein